MGAIKFISSKVHAWADYLTGVFLLFLPWFFSETLNRAGKWLAIVSGIVIILMSLLTNYSGGAIKLIPMKIHLAADVVMGIFFIFSFWLFRLEGTPGFVFVFVGILAVFFGLFTVNRPYGRRRLFHYYN
jgi:hypothetical protein